MKFGKLLKALFAPSLEEELSKLDAHLLEDIGFGAAHARTATVRIPAEIGTRLA